MIKKILISIAIILVTNNLFAQIKINFKNKEKITLNGKFNKEYKAIDFVIPKPNLEKAFAKEEEQAKNGSKLFFIAQPIATQINLKEKASWVVDEKFNYGKFTLKSADAKTLSINFSNFILPNNTEMFIYNKSGEMINEGITEKDNNVNNVWGSSVFKGDEINIEIKIPTESYKEFNLMITNVAYGYKEIFGKVGTGFGQSGACNINVLCAQGNNWANERYSVAHILSSNGQGFFSGAIIMNTCNNDIPYILTADHCLNPPNAPQEDVTKWRFYFQAWSSTCSQTQNSEGVLFNGASLKANWAPSDFCLVQLNEIPRRELVTLSAAINYAGWSRSTTAPTNGVGIHHPKGDVMKISTYNIPPIRIDNGGTWTVGTQVLTTTGILHWLVQWPTSSGFIAGAATNGITEGGSSGSPLFNQSGHIVGQLAGGPSDCSINSVKQDFYGRFDDSWTGGGTPSTRLSDWLDPNNTGALTTNTTSLLSLFNVSRPFTINGSSNICSGTSTYSIFLPVGYTVTWSISNPAVASLLPTGNTVAVTYLQSGQAILKATITSPCGTIYESVPKTITVGTPLPNGNFFYSSGSFSGSLFPMAGNPINTGITTGSASVSGATSLNWQLITPVGRGVIFNTTGGGNSGTANFTFDNTSRPTSFINVRLTGTNICGSFSGNFHFIPSNCSLCPRMSSSVIPDIQASPNPTSDLTRLKLPLEFENNTSFEIHSQNGNVLKRGSVINSKGYFMVNLNGYPAGVYTIILFNKESVSKVQVIKN